MAPSHKAKAAGVSAGSFFDLKAELVKQEEEFAKNRAAGGSKYVVGGVKRSDKKPTVWARSNKGVNARAAQDTEIEALSKVTVESARAALERKAKVYDKLRKGKSGGLNEKQYEALLVDFDSKDALDMFESDSDDVDESLTVPKPVAEEDDPIVEYEDEFGRIRTGRRSEIPRNLLSRSQDHELSADDDQDVIHNPVNFFPVYEPSADRVKAVEEAFSEANNPLGVHYDASAEVRAKGAGFYQFSADEETRKQQMDELRSARTETEKTRQEVGATDLRPGEVEGMRDDDNGGKNTSRSRAMEKRKREIEERRKLLDAKRRKVNIENVDHSLSMESEASQIRPRTSVPIIDPFAALERHAPQPESSTKGKIHARNSSEIAADAFLAQLEKDMLKTKSK
ncbi:hypothetical protein BJ138DRAFT_33155 [Hygrophoropsis aurantiaca]|uniref:Uncharacterized protein n=1 Tax=Hygrophoropsis aurantiaca TaxID=72124 RepID=A0ACB8AE47_9AGAM|nr:hypothetical protein BJ138DRAFT_33155 [Hygrophoropsis aurantiaca]